MHDPDDDAPFDPARTQFVGCRLCGHDTSDIPGSDLPSAITEASRRWADWLRTVLDHPNGLVELLAPPEPGTWCALEYACHARDVIAVTTQHVLRMIVEEVPTLTPWDQEAAAEHENYAQQDPAYVADDIEVNAVELAEILQVLTGDAWLRRGALADKPFTVLGAGRYVLHELLHHLMDARDGVAPEVP